MQQPVCLGIAVQRSILLDVIQADEHDRVALVIARSCPVKVIQHDLHGSAVPDAEVIIFQGERLDVSLIAEELFGAQGELRGPLFQLSPVAAYQVGLRDDTHELVVAIHYGDMTKAARARRPWPQKLASSREP